MMAKPLEVVVAFRLRAVFVILAVCAVALFSPQSPGTRTVAAQTGVTIVGSVVDSALTPLAGVAVVLERDTREQARTTTGADGKFRFTGIAAGAYRVRAELGGFEAFSKDLRVPANVATVQLPIVMSRPGEKRDKDEQSTVDKLSRAQPVQPPPPPAMSTPPPPANTAKAAGGRGGGGATGAVGQQGQGARDSKVSGMPQSTIGGLPPTWP